MKKRPGTIIRSLSNSKHNSPISEGQKILNEIKLLCDTNQYEEALKKIELIENKYPSCSKALSRYRGLARYEIAKQNGTLPKMTHMKD